MWVLITQATNGVNHAWGPYETRSKAMTQKRRFIKADKEAWWEDHTVTYMILKVLSGEPDS